MTNLNIKYFVSLGLIISGITLNAQNYSIQPVPFNQVSIHDGFWTPRLEAHANKTLHVCIAQTQDSTKRISNFKKAAGLKEGRHEGIFFDDSDVYKAMEGIAYSLINNPNSEHEALLDKWIDLIARSQQPDGYLNTFYTLNDDEQRWTDIMKHEMYCGGHMIEAAIAHHQATGKKTFLNIAIKFANHLDNKFGPGKRHWVPGHQEIELALVKLYHETNEKRYLDLAHWLLEERGQGHFISTWENSRRGAEYSQDDVSVTEITDVKGHAVRAMYQYTGMADVAAEKNLPEYVKALQRVWGSVVHRNMYVTGGIGSTHKNEGFTHDYDLPNKTAYCETCASIGMVFWNNRMNLLSGESKFVDILERSLYNGVLSGVSLEGDLFFYVNPLESDGNHHRRRWYGTACCPSNIARFIPSVGNYIYLTGEDELVVNLFISNESDLEIKDTKLKVVQKTDYPWNGKIQVEVNPARALDFDLKMRIPDWCKSYQVALNGKEISKPVVSNGYLLITRNWKAGDEITLLLDMPVELVAADPKVKENIGKRAIQRGPLVYCLEQTDNPSINMDNVSMNQGTAFSLHSGEGKLKEMKILKANTENGELTFVPYFAWDNREAGKMKVWVDFNKKTTLYK
jgi:uncharacterized protein